MSDQETEYAMLDRISFIRFVGLSLEESVPDLTTIISSAARSRKHVDVEVIVCDREEASSPAAKGAIVSVSYSHDSDASWTKKGKNS